MIWIPALVQCLPKYIPAQLHPPADQYPRQLPELDVCQTIFSKLEAASVTDSDDAGWPCLRLRFEKIDQTLETVLFRLSSQTLSLPEAVGKDEGAVTQEVEDVTEEDTITVQEYSESKSYFCNLVCKTVL